MTSSYSPERNFDATKKPGFNGNPATLFAEGTLPAGWQTWEGAAAVAPGASTAATGVTINAAGEGFDDGSAAGVATTALTGGGSGLTVDVTISSGQMQAATVNAGGSGYAQGDTVSVTGYDGVVLGVTVTSD